MIQDYLGTCSPAATDVMPSLSGCAKSTRPRVASETPELDDPRSCGRVDRRDRLSQTRSGTNGPAARMSAGRLV
jgi:hypothetical protein